MLLKREDLPTELEATPPFPPPFKTPEQLETSEKVYIPEKKLKKFILMFKFVIFF